MRHSTRCFSRLALWAASIGFFCAGVGSVALLSQGPACTNEPFTFLYPSPSFIRNQGGSGITAWRKSSISNCPSQAVSQVSWITVFPNQSQTSSGVAFFTVEPGVTDPRVGSLRISSFPGSPDGSDFAVVQAGVRDPIITAPFELPPARQGVPYSIQLAFTTVAGGPPGPVSWSVRSGSGLPPGLALSDSGLLSGTPTQSGAYGLTVGATLAGSIYTDIQGFSLQVLSTSPQQFFRLPPCRVMDTRASGGKSPPFGPPILTAGDTRTIPLPAASCGVPNSATAFSLNVTVVPAGPLAFLSIWPSNTPRPVVSTLNAFEGTVVANAAIVSAGPGGQISVFVSDASDVIIDVNGYFAPPDLQGLAFYPVAPCRIADTRAGSGFTGAFGSPPLTAGAVRDFPLPASACGIPPSAQAYSLNMTAVPHRPLAFLSVWPASQAQPLVSTLNSFDGRIVANAAIVPAGANGAISTFVTDTSDLVIDVNGYFAPPGQPGALGFYLLPPCRIADTRQASGFSGAFGSPALVGGAVRDFPVRSSSCAIPAAAQAYSLNMTVVPPGPLFFLSVWPAALPQPLVSTLNSFQGRIVANAAIVPAGANGAISTFVSNPSDLIIDINGYFAP